VSESIRPFRLEVSDAAVADLHARIDRTRWPDELNDPQWGYGVSLQYLRELCDYWRNRFDWRAGEARINTLPQFLTAIDGLDLHFVHARAAHPDATPLLITHGWPGSIVEFLELIPRLTHPDYFQMQRTRCQTLSYALNDSAVGWCAWVTEKFHGWTDCERDGVRDPRNAVSWDDMLTNISLYWFTQTIASSIRLYKEQALAEARGDERPGRVQVPTGVAVYPGEIFRCPRAWAERRFPVVHWYEAPRGGHFAALEQPGLFAADLRLFRRAVRAAR
jgi:pimeloyl-ACP methyl ester carboxylesterase